MDALRGRSISMQLEPEFVESLMFIVLIVMGVFALLLILGYSVYGEEDLDE